MDDKFKASNRSTDYSEKMADVLIFFECNDVRIALVSSSCMVYALRSLVFPHGLSIASITNTKQTLLYASCRWVTVVCPGPQYVTIGFPLQRSGHAFLPRASAHAMPVTVTELTMNSCQIKCYNAKHVLATTESADARHTVTRFFVRRSHGYSSNKLFRYARQVSRN